MTDGVNIAMNELVADGIKGPFFSTTFSRSFKDRTGAWRNAGPFSFRGLEVLSCTSSCQDTGHLAACRVS